MKQREIFLQGEGDCWFERNIAELAKVNLPDGDSLLQEILRLKDQLPAAPMRVHLLEVGCGPGVRLEWIKQHLGYECCGIEPSEKSVQFARSKGMEARVGTADCLPFEDGSFDVVVFGFCLYLCDRDDLFRIAAEADRVLKTPGWLLIKDFYSPTAISGKYRHRTGVQSYKMDYRSLFDWHPSYRLFSHHVVHHESGVYTDDAAEWVATSVLRKS